MAFRLAVWSQRSGDRNIIEPGIDHGASRVGGTFDPIHFVWKCAVDAAVGSRVHSVWIAVNTIGMVCVYKHAGEPQIPQAA